MSVTASVIAFALESDAFAEQQAKLISLAERYWVIYQSLVRPPRLSLRSRRIEGDRWVMPFAGSSR